MMYFKWKEFDQKGLPGSGELYMDREFVELLDELRGVCGFPFIISSAYRSPEYNNKVSSSGLKGPHTTGKAVDILVYGKQAHKLIDLATKFEFKGIGISQKGDYKTRFVHLDTLSDNENNAPRPWIWSY